MLTVRDLLGDLDVRVLAGEGGLDLPVRWVHITELLDPTPWLSGGELLLTTGLQLDDAERQREFVSRLADHQLAGLGFGTGFGHREVPPAILRTAAERDFPVFEVPYELPFIAVTEAAFTQLVNEQYAVLRRALSAQERLERIVLSERGLEALVGAIATLIGATVLVFDSRGEPLMQRAFRRVIDADALQALQREVRERVRRREARAFMPPVDEGNQGLALPVASDGGGTQGGAPGPARVPEAWLVAIKDSGPLSDFDRLTLHQAVTIVALELLRARVAGDTERRLAGDVLAAVVRGELAGVDLARRLAPFGLSDRVAAIVVQRPAGGRGSPAPTETALLLALRDEAMPALVASSGQFTCGLVAGMPDDELLALAERVGARLDSELGAPLLLGVGRAVPGGDARRSFHEARCAVEALALGVPSASGSGNGSGAVGAAPGPARVATYKDLGSFQLLLSLQDDEALRLFCDSVLGPIEASEGHYGGELMRSLEAFIEENGQWERAARRLYCHRHTLRYRIRRVEDLTGRDLSSARDRIEFWLALRGRELVA
ncbi:MAG: PucR family transcriptional regulator ligand-binding domain-containing protein [Solirubrobacterales bacterium]|nr:PucR family transcriptional regulator ligand-binding domain-containing protein [Solirubrobacterales bacterium]MBV9422868.1 PucR family transcriptional regulator ligand-binding domain-containing protein [Solirubrobacterales bacterium]MBV9796420.1 PucR family transcriptional regulator ligand-binding domain-containing protein [Solirubrobacterales bacterium]